MAQAPTPVSATQPQLMLSQPGISRDGTRLSRRTHVDAQWCRWYQAKPRKMGGYQEQLRSVNGIVRAIDVFSNDGYSYVHIATGNAIQRYAIDNMTGATAGLITRTPVGYIPDARFNWQLAEQFDIPTDTTMIFANGTPSASSITSSQAYPVYYGDIVDSAPLTAITDTGTGSLGPILSSGGVAAVGPYVFIYGHDGIVRWTVPANPTDWSGAGSGDARPIGDKIVRAYPLRGQSGPAIIMWSLSAIIIGQFVGPPDFWDFTTATVSASILSSNSIVEQDGIFYWPTTSGFSMFNGVVRELPNSDSKHWFFDNLNFQQRQKAFTFKVPKWSEIWFCAPLFGATECSHALIWNWSEKCWYDTVLPNGGRSAGFYEFVFNYPVMAGVVPNADTGGGTSVWQHEVGYDEVSGQIAVPKAIYSYYQTNEFSLCEPQQPGQLGMDQALSWSILEPDFEQVGDLMFSVISRANARAAESTLGPLVISEVPATPKDQLVKFKHTGRLTSFQIESNTLGGYYFAGSPLIHSQPGDARKED
jgi:hypothetical protein